MQAVNSFCNAAFAVIWGPFRGMSPWVGLTVLSVVVGVLALIAFKYTSNQKRIVEVKDKYKGHLLAIRLFRDDFLVVMSSLGRTLVNVGLYLGHNLRPMLVMLVPMMLLFAQMQMHLAYRPIQVGEKFLVELRLNEHVEPELVQKVALDQPDGLMLVSQVRIKAQRRVIYEFQSTRPVDGELRFTIGDQSATKACVIADEPGDLRALAGLRGSSLAEKFMYPTESGFESNAPFSKVELKYPVRPLMLGSLDLSFGSEIAMGLWLVGISIVAALLLKGFFGVTF